MPRCSTLKPVALATIACSKLIFDPSANDVTIAGFCPHRSANALLGRRVAVRVLEALDVADHARGRGPRPFDPAVQVHLQPGSSPSQADRITPCSLGVDLQDRPDRGVDLGVHQHDVLAVGERLEDDVGAELDRPGDVDDDVDLLGCGRAGSGPR